jgi:YD repeat-containing protein
MMFGLGSLIVHLAANTAAFSSDLGKAAHEADRRMKSIGDAAEKAGKIMGVALLAAGGTMAVLVKQAINGADAMSKLSQGAGLATSAFSEIAYAARLSGVSTEQFSTSITRLNRNISDTAANTGEAREAFAALGIQVKGADGVLKNADAVMAEVADKFAGMEDGAGKSALAVMLFGRAGAAMIPMLNQGSAGMASLRDEARALGLTIDTETGQAAERFNDNLTRLNAAKQGVANTIMRALLPQMNALTDAMVKAAKEGDKFTGIAKGAVILFQTLAVLGSDVAFTFRGLGGAIGVLAAQIAALLRNDTDAFDLIGKEWKKDSAQARVELDAFQQRVMNLGKTAEITGTFLEDVWQMGKGKAPTLARSGEAERVAAANKRLLEESMRGAVQAAEAMQREADELVYTWDAIGNRVTMTREEFRQLEQQAQRATQSWVESAHIATELGEGMIYTWDQAGNRIEITRDAFGELTESAKRAAEAGKELGWAFGSAFENAVIEGRKVRDMVRGLAQDIARIALRQFVTQPMANAISGALAGAFGGAGGSMAGAAVTGVPGYASGTDYVPRTGLALVHQGERITPAGQNGGGVTIVQNLNVSAETPLAMREVVFSLMPQIGQMAVRAVMDAKARGAG